MARLVQILRSRSRGPRLVGRLALHEPGSLRFASDWLRSLEPRDEPVADRTPWLPYRAQAWLDRHLTPDMTVFEYGCGGSTFFLASRVGRLVSVEHDRGWHAAVSEALTDKRLDSCTCLLREPRPLTGEPPVYGFTSCTSSRDEYRGMTFDEYVGSIGAHPDETFDAVIVDGRARLSCLERALPKVRPGGWLILDNSERPEYADAFSRLAGHPREDLFGYAPYRTYRWQFTIWRIGASVA